MVNAPLHLWHTSDGGGGGGTASSAGAASWDGVGGADASDAAAGFLQWREWDRRARSELKTLGQHGHWILPEGVAPSSVDSALGAGVVVSDAPMAAGCAASMVSSTSAACMVADASSAACMVVGAGSAAGASMASFRACAVTAITRRRLPRWLL